MFKKLLKKYKSKESKELSRTENSTANSDINSSSSANSYINSSTSENASENASSNSSENVSSNVSENVSENVSSNANSDINSSTSANSDINSELSDISSILNNNVAKLLNRGEKIDDLIIKSNSLKDSADLFKKLTKDLIEPDKIPRRSSDFRTENNFVSINQYEQHLMSLLNNENNYQYVLEKSAQLGLTNIFKIILEKSRQNDIHLKIDQPLKLAATIGHYEIIEMIIDEDMLNDRYRYTKQRPSIKPFYPFYEGQRHIPYINIPLTISDIKDAIHLAITNGHKEINNILSDYFIRSFDWKESYINN